MALIPLYDTNPLRYIRYPYVTWGLLAANVLIFFLVGFIAAPAVWIWGMVAANNDAHKWNRAHGILS